LACWVPLATTTFTLECATVDVVLDAAACADVVVVLLEVDAFLK
jgi:hypothetical protein